MQLHKRKKLKPRCAATIDSLQERLSCAMVKLHCPTYDKSPTVSLDGATLESLRVTIKGCCPEFIAVACETIRKL